MASPKDEISLDTKPSTLDPTKTWVTGAAIQHIPADGRPRILAVQRAAHETQYPIQWELPGGHIEATDTSVRSALAREVDEETSLQVDGFLVRFGDLRWTSRTGRVSVQLNWLVTVASDEQQQQQQPRVVLNDEEHVDFRWIERGHVAGLEMTDAMRTVMGDAFDAADELMSR